MAVHQVPMRILHLSFLQAPALSTEGRVAVHKVKEAGRWARVEGLAAAKEVRCACWAALGMPCHAPWAQRCWATDPSTSAGATNAHGSCTSNPTPLLCVGPLQALLREKEKREAAEAEAYRRQHQFKASPAPDFSQQPAQPDLSQVGRAGRILRV